MVKYSIIIPVYNAEHDLHVSVESVLNQSFQDWEIVLVNDGSTDSSKKICEDYARLTTKIKLYEQDNSGAGIARSAGIKNAEGRYYIFLDSDDSISADYLSKIDNNIDEKTDIMICDYYSAYEENGNSFSYESLGLKAGVYDENQIRELLFPLALGKCGRKDKGPRMTRALWNYVFSADLIRKSNIEFCSERTFFSEDLLFLLSVLEVSTQAQYLPNAGYTHFYQKKSLSSDVAYINWKSMERLYYKELDWCKKNNMMKEVDRVKYMLLINVWGASKKICATEDYSKEISARLSLIEETDILHLISDMSKLVLAVKERVFLYLLKMRYYKLIYFIIKK